MFLYACIITSSVLLLSSKAQQDSESCESLTIDPPHLLVRYGDTARANCSTTGQVAQIGWETPVGTAMNTNTDSLVWSVENLTDWSLERIQCYTVKVEQCIKDLNIIMYKLPDTVSIEPWNTTGVYEEGQLLQLTCVAPDVGPASRARVTWYKGERQLQNVTFLDATQKMENLRDTLEVAVTRDDHGAQLRCEVTLELEGLQPYPTKSSKPLEIAVEFRPKINCPSKVQVQENEGLPNCTAEGNPTPEVTWFKGQHQVAPLSPLGRADGGWYTVNAKNRMGTVIQPVNVEIWFGPEISCPKRIQVKENDGLPSCAAGNPPPVITWFKGHPVNPLSPLSRNQGGCYTILARNTVGGVNQTVDVEVLFGPEIVCPERLNVTEGETLTGCTIKGNPTPVVTWYKGGQKFDPKRTLGKGDSGEYSLTAEGNSSTHHTVEVVVISRGSNISMSSGCVLLVVLLCHIFHWL